MSAKSFLIPGYCQLRRASHALWLMLVACTAVSAAPLPSAHVDEFTGKPRVIVLTDVGNEPDDQMSFVRLLMYANELDLEALVATTSIRQPQRTRQDTLYELIDAYGKVQPNLLLHAAGWPEATQHSAVISNQ